MSPSHWMGEGRHGGKRFEDTPTIILSPTQRLPGGREYSLVGF